MNRENCKAIVTDKLQVFNINLTTFAARKGKNRVAKNDMETEPNMLLLFAKMLGALALLVFGMKYMSESLQKLAGSQLRHTIAAMTGNRVTAILTGTLVTVAVQSSSATTVLTVSFVSAGLLTLAQAISVIMGANIGTTLTAWIMSAGVSFSISDLVWPAFVVGILLIYSKSRRSVGDFLFGAAFMLLSLGMLSSTGKEMDLANNAAMVSFFAGFDSASYLTVLLFLAIGTVLTCILQSSAAVMAITILLCSSGVMPLYLGVALVMGENIGTTLTANLAAVKAGVQARRAAFAHLFFNVFGVLWVLVVFFPFVDLACSIVGLDAANAGDPTKISFALAMFHTCFNVLNTLILVWFVPQIERFVCMVIKDSPADEAAEGQVRLHYIEGGLVTTPEIAVLQAQREVAAYGEHSREMFGHVVTLLNTPAGKEFDAAFDAIVAEEDHSDHVELAIADFLAQVGDRHLSDETKGKVRTMLRQIGEVESVGDACNNLARTIKRFRSAGEKFTEQQTSEVQEMMSLVDKALAQMNIVLDRYNRRDPGIKESLRLENEINALRDRLRSENLEAVNEHRVSYTVGTAFNDLVCECEKLGDYVINVAQARYGK